VTLRDNPEDRHLIVGHLLYQDVALSLRNNTDYDDFTLPVMGPRLQGGEQPRPDLEPVPL